MQKKNIVIAGSGFAGTSAFRRLNRYRGTLVKYGYEIILIDEKDDFEFIPMLPDLIGGWLDPARLRSSNSELASQYGCSFIKGRIDALDPERKMVSIGVQNINYEYLIISTGSCTNFFNNQLVQASCRKVDTIADALNIKEELSAIASKKGEVDVVVIGGGYTGIESATNIRWLFRREGTVRCHVTMVEKAPDILMAVPEWMRKEAHKELEGLGVIMICGDSLKSYDGRTVNLESGRSIKADICLWTAGVKLSPYLDGLKAEKERTRIKVTPTLKIKEPKYDNIFVAGDTANFQDNDTALAIRMAVMFSMGQGKVAAENIVRSISNKRLIEYRAVDLGYLIPMAHGKATGIVLGRRVHGLLGYLLHYCMCIYRSEWKNMFGIVKDLTAKMAGSAVKKRGRVQ
ncbi:MAG: FAD-dependent oxidoreductase [Candidatus Omnitrophica bacterium]|nr:FAD-dependent oxidoreductase [Candidatus Omnitrophota bacterium]